MGYRHNLGTLSKDIHEQIKDLSIEEIEKLYKGKYDDPWGEIIPCYTIVNEIYELGKYYEDSFLKPFRSEVFTNKEVNEAYQDEKDFYFISKEGLEAIIQSYHKKTADYFKELLEGDDEKDPNKVKNFLREKLSEWRKDFKLTPYNLNLKSDEIVSSWSYEYAIFELVRIYKSIDWDKEYVTITAW